MLNKDKAPLARSSTAIKILHLSDQIPTKDVCKTKRQTAGARRSLTAGVGERTKGAHSIAARLGVQP